MSERAQDRLFAACGIASAVLVHVGLFVGVASGQAFVNLGSSPAKVTHALANPAGTGIWVGAYLDVLGYGAFLAFAPWRPRSRTSTKPSTSAAGSCPPSFCSPPVRSR